MKIAYKLMGSYIGFSLLTGAAGAVMIFQGHRIAQNIAISEAKHTAQLLATSISQNVSLHKHSISLEDSNELQAHVLALHEEQQRDIEIIDRKKVILADVVVEDIGSVLDHDENNETQQTMQDGKIRTYLEKSKAYPEGIKLIVAPLVVNGQTQGAVILEWSVIYNEAIAQASPILNVIGITSLGFVVLLLLVGLQISRSIVKPLQAVTDVAVQAADESNFDLQAPVTTKDETGILATALNHLIQRVKELLHEKEQRSEELQYAFDQLHSMQLQLVQTEKMSSLGQLVAGVAHEINNPVNFIHGNLTHLDSYTQDLLKVIQAYQAHYPNSPQTLQATLDDVELDFLCEDVAKLLQSMKVGTDRIRQIILSLRNFSRLDESEFKAVDLHEGIDSTLLILQYRLKARPGFPAIEVVKNYGQLPLIECYPSQLNQVFMNLLANAIDALEDSTRHQTKGNQPTQSGIIWISTRLTAGNQVQIAIADNGSGIPETVRSRIFDPFFTTKGSSQGTGLGLSISHQIVTEKHKGTMKCDSIPGEGTKFVVEIPVCQLNQ